MVRTIFEGPLGNLVLTDAEEDAEGPTTPVYYRRDPSGPWQVGFVQFPLVAPTKSVILVNVGKSDGPSRK